MRPGRCARCAFHHALGRALHGTESAGEVGVDDGGEVLLANAQEQLVVGDSGVGHQDVHGAMGCFDFLEGFVDAF